MSARPQSSPLVVVATPGEADAIGDLGLRVTVSGVGSTAAALATASALARQPAPLVVSAGIAGAFRPAGLGVGDLAVSSRIIQADLGTLTADGWLGLSDLGLSVGDLAGNAAQANFPVWQGAAELARQLSGAVKLGPMLTLNAITGTEAQAEALLARYPRALTEGMEGAGVAHAAALAGVPALELRGISNFVGKRDRAAWDIPAALRATRRGLACLTATLAGPTGEA